MKILRLKKRTKISGIALAISLLAFHFAPLPETLEHQSVATLLVADQGELLAAKIADDEQWRFPRNERLPEKYLIAVTQFEDRYFFQHPGVNPLAIGRALISNVKADHIVSGGSTITMQLARLIRNDPPRTYRNKIIEMFIALKLEWHYSKDEILSLYASHAPFGGNTIGIGAASWRYFGRYLEHGNEVTQLSWAEAAMLAVLPNSPALMHPGKAREKLKAKRDRLLTRLFERSYLSENEFTLSVLEPLPDKPKPLPQSAPHLLQTLMAQYPQQNILHTTVAAQLQNKVLNVGNFSGKQLAREGIHNVSIVVIDNQTMQVRAYIGNIATAVDNDNTRDQHGADVDIASRPRSTGSILKPLLYGSMLQAGEILPETLIADIPTDYRGFTPENYDHQYRGAVPAKQALAQSLNIPAVRMLKQYGVAKFHSDLKAMGMSTLFRAADDYGLSLILGGAEGNLLELSALYAHLIDATRSSSRDVKPKPLQLLRDSDTANQINATNAMNKTTFPIGPGAAWLTLEALQEVVRPGYDSQWRRFSGSQKIAWKTGTSYGLRDAWAIGSNGNYTVGVWAGNAGGEGVAGLSGVHSAAPLMFEVFNVLGYSKWVTKPEFDLKTISTCKDDGYLALDNCPMRDSLAPVSSHFQKVSSRYKKIHLDRLTQTQVHGGCETVSNMQTVDWFVLPPVQEFYWRPHHSEYRSLPPWREDCVATLANFTNDVPMEFIYPNEGSTIYIPYELNGAKGRVVFEASHRNSQSKLYWHVDDKFIATTELYHNVELNVDPGWHKVITVDELGFRLERWFRIVGRDLADAR